MSTNTDTTDQTRGSSNTLLVFIIVAVFFGAMFYILIRYGSTLISELRLDFNGGVPDQAHTHGLSPSDIEAFPTFIYRGATRNGNGNSNFSGNYDIKRHGISVDCSICLCDLQEDDVVRMLPPCRHFFHIQCIDVWLCAHPSCPICRASLQTENVALNDCSMSPPLWYLHRCNDLDGNGEANTQTTTEEIQRGSGITEIVVGQEDKMAGNMDISSTRSTYNQSIEAIDINEFVDMEMCTEYCSNKPISTKEALWVSNIGSPSKSIPNLGSLKTPIDGEIQEHENQEILETTTINESPLIKVGSVYANSS